MEEVAAEDAAAAASSKLAPTVRLLLRCITDLSTLRKELGTSTGLDMPLGALSRRTISEGWRVLSAIADLLKRLEHISQFKGRRLRELKEERQKINASLNDLSNKFYMVCIYYCTIIKFVFVLT